MNDLTAQAIVNNEYDYSNVLPTAESISYVVRFCHEAYKALVRLIEEDEEKNRKYVEEYKDYTYKKTYSSTFEVTIQQQSFNSLVCNDYDSFMSAANSNNLNDVRSLEIRLKLDFGRGKGTSIDKHENSFIISFKPYEIRFRRKSNHNDPKMNQIEQGIDGLMKKFTVANCIFCNRK